MNLEEINLGSEPALSLYGIAAKRLNEFFSRVTSVYCSDCLGFHRAARPADPIAGHVLVEGIFPGCCQSGVADDMRIPDSRSSRLPASLAAKIEGQRGPRPATPGHGYAVREVASGKLYHGCGCQWMGEAGCLLDEWKSPICLFYVCDPLREILGVRLGRGGTPLEEDFCGFLPALRAIALAEDKEADGVAAAVSAVGGLIEALDELELALLPRSAADRPRQGGSEKQG